MPHNSERFALNTILQLFLVIWVQIQRRLENLSVPSTTILSCRLNKSPTIIIMFINKHCELSYFPIHRTNFSTFWNGGGVAGGERGCHFKYLRDITLSI